MHYSNIINPNTIIDTRLIVESDYINWGKLKNKSILITGATGFIGAQTVLALSKASMDFNLNIKLVLPVRNIKKAKSLFFKELPFVDIKLLKHDLGKKLSYGGQIDYIIHAASNTSSKSFIDYPVETINTTLNGTRNILEIAKEKNIESIVYLSSMEIYGTLSSDIPVKEDELGPLNLLNERNSYPQAKRMTETMLYSYFKEYNLPVKIARLCQIIGGSVPFNDTRVFAQFARNVVENQDIVLHTDGSTVRNYCDITDCVTAILKILTEGKSGEAYNVANKNAVCSIKEMAEKIASKKENINIKYKITNDNKYLPHIKLLLNTEKLEALGWRAEISIDDMFTKLVDGLLAQKNQSMIKYSFKDKLKSYICLKNFGGYKNLSLFGLKLKIPNNWIYEHIYKFLPIDNKKIVFSCFAGNGYGCNPKYITEELINKNINCKMVWLTLNPKLKKNMFPQNIHLVDVQSERAIYEQATAKIWIDNIRKTNFIKRGLSKKTSQKYIQTWHGSLGIKKIGSDANPNFWDKQFSSKFFKKDSEMTDIIISNSSFETGVYRRNISSKANIKEIGHPRNDILFKDNRDVKERIYKQYKLDENSKILLYVPTFRDNKHISCYNIDYPKLLEPLTKKFGGDWKIFIRLHPNINQLTNILVPKHDSIFDATMYPDIQELMAVSDIAITDYSSCIFDFMLTRKPGFIYATDINEYDTERGFYYSLEETPFPIARNNDELIENILNFDNEKYQKEIEIFLRDKGCIENGHASQHIVKLIKTIIEEKG